MDNAQLARLGFDAARLARVTDRIARDIDAGRSHGVAMKVSRGGETVLDLLEGYADQKAGRRLAADSVFATMSVGKQFTNVVVLSFVERGLLRLHTPVVDVLPEFGALGKGRVNLFHLLTHTSGVVSAIPSVPPEVLTSIEGLAKLACGQMLESLPGERVNYSILVAHSLMAAMCVRVDGGRRRFTQIMEDELFRPLGMRDTCLGPREDLLARLCPVRATYTGAGMIAPEAIEGIEQLIRIPGCEIPAGGYLTTIGDLHRFAEMLRRGGELGGARVLSPAMLDYCTRNHTGDRRNLLFDAAVGYRNWDVFPAYIGIGFFLRGEVPTPGPFGLLNSPRTFGGVGAGSTGFWIDPARDLACSFLSTGIWEDTHHFERLGAIADLVVAAMVR